MPGDFDLGLVREAVKLADGTTAIENPTPDALPIKSCLSALAELRRAKWFQIKCAPLQSSVITLRIIRDISNRVKTWTPLSTWAMELLTEKTLISIALQYLESPSSVVVNQKRRHP